MKSEQDQTNRLNDAKVFKAAKLVGCRAILFVVVSVIWAFSGITPRGVALAFLVMAFYMLILWQDFNGVAVATKMSRELQDRVSALEQRLSKEPESKS